MRSAIGKVATQLGLNPETLRNWVNQAEVDQGRRNGLTTDERRRMRELEKENRELRRANEILKSAAIFFGAELRPPTAEVVAYIDSHREAFGVEPICAALQFAPSTYYARKTRRPSRRSVRDVELSDKIVDLHRKHRSVYGLRKLWKAAIRDDIDIGRDHLGRLMGALGLRGVVRGKAKRTTIVDPQADRPADLVDRQFRAAEPNRLWVADITYVPTWSGFCYVAFVTDVFSRMIVGWQVATNLRAELALDALEQAIWRRGREVSGLIHHSDRGSPIPRDPLLGALGIRRSCHLGRFARRQLPQRHGRVRAQALQSRVRLERRTLARPV